MSEMDPAHTVPMSTVECACALRHLQYRRRQMYEDTLALEERIRAKVPIAHDLDTQRRTLGADIMILDGLIQRLFSMCGPPRAHPP